MLHRSVKDGLGAIAAPHRGCFADDIRTSFGDSLDIDTELKPQYPQANRRDYLLGHDPTRQLIAVETHSARNDQVRRVIDKREAALTQLRDHLRDGARVSRWLWVASGRVDLHPLEPATLRLAQNGIKFVGRQIKSGDIA